MRLAHVVVVIAAFFSALGCCASVQAAQSPLKQDLDRVDWQPTRTMAGARYVGTEICAQCHPAEAVRHSTSAMAHALEPAAGSAVLQQHPRLTFSNGPYRYTVEREGNEVSYAVTDDVKTISVSVPWAFGSGGGEVGQTYLFSYNGSYYEGRVSFFNGVDGLDTTLGHPRGLPASIEDALGRMLQPEELRACFGCHSTGAVSDGALRIDTLVPGISCEGCHGPGAEHVAAMRAGKSKELHIFSPGSLEPGDQVKFCGACHRTRAHVEALQVRGILTVRFQPYRLTESKCFNPSDRRISCLGCHDPHQSLQHEPTVYDANCLACHGAHKKPQQVYDNAARPCPTAGSRCVSCHMPKYMLPGSHFRFTDHRIRVVRLGDTFD